MLVLIVLLRVCLPPALVAPARAHPPIGWSCDCCSRGGCPARVVPAVATWLSLRLLFVAAVVVVVALAVAVAVVAPFLVHV